MLYGGRYRVPIIGRAKSNLQKNNMKPLNGNKTHPLTEFARQELKRISQAPVPSQTVNPGVINRLLRGNLIQLVQLPSPYKKHKGKNCEHLQITEAGRQELL